MEKPIYDDVGLKVGIQTDCFIFDMNGMLVGNLSDCNREDDASEKRPALEE
jgi:hypothetical protein